MATNYPGSIDSLTNPSAGDALTSPSHSAQHANANDAIEAIETELGVNPSGSDATVAARLTAIEAGTNLATGAVTSAKIADGTIATGDIADAAVTAAKLATSGRFDFPAGASGGYGFASGAVHLSGTGSPEGVVTAAPGSTWLQTDATTDVKGWIRWVKATGTGNTGWIAGPEADTGRRNVAVDIDADWAVNASAGYIRLQRVGERVYFEARLDRVTASGSRGNYDAVYTVPSGFAPRNAYNVRGLAIGPGGVAGFVGDLSTPGQMQVWFPSGGTWAASDDVHFTAEWYTNDAWPSSLPGSAI